jgi:hypothetical protein
MSSDLTFDIAPHEAVTVISLPGVEIPQTAQLAFCWRTISSENIEAKERVAFSCARMLNDKAIIIKNIFFILYYPLINWGKFN